LVLGILSGGCLTNSLTREDDEQVCLGAFTMPELICGFYAER